MITSMKNIDRMTTPSNGEKEAKKKRSWIVRRTIVEIIYVDAFTKKEAIDTCYDYSVADIELKNTTAKIDKEYENTPLVTKAIRQYLNKC